MDVDVFEEVRLKGEIPQFVAWVCSVIDDFYISPFAVMNYDTLPVAMGTVPFPWPTFDPEPVIEIPWRILSSRPAEWFWQMGPREFQSPIRQRNESDPDWFVRISIKPVKRGRFEITIENSHRCAVFYCQALLERIEQSWDRVKKSKK